MSKFSLAIIALACLYSTAYAESQSTKVCLKNICIQAQIADSDYSRQMGLMYRESLADTEGMLFIFKSEDMRGFWMQNMKFPLDIIWFSQDKRIVDITRDARPCQEDCQNIMPREKVKYVLEVNSGFVDKHKIELGERIDF